MATRPTISDVATGYTSNVTIDANFDAIVEEFDNLLGLGGGTMTGDIDMNSNDILNANTINAESITIDGSSIVPATKVPDWEGEWTTATAYAVDDLVREDGSTYICVEAHTSGTFSTDLTANKWELFAQKGAAGAGTGDLLAANNLSDLANADTALSNLGGGTVGTAIFKDATAGAVRTELSLVPGTDVQVWDAALDDISAITFSSGDILYWDGSDLVNLGAGSEDQILQMGASSTPQWVDTLTRGSNTDTTGNTTITSDDITETVSGRRFMFRDLAHNAASGKALYIEFYDANAGTWSSALQCSPTLGVGDYMYGEVYVPHPYFSDLTAYAYSNWHDNGSSQLSSSGGYTTGNSGITVYRGASGSVISKVRFSWEDDGVTLFSNGGFREWRYR